MNNNRTRIAMLFVIFSLIYVVLLSSIIFTMIMFDDKQSECNRIYGENSRWMLKKGLNGGCEFEQ